MTCEDGSCWPSNLLTIQRAAAVKRRLAALDREIADCHAEGYDADADRLLDERRRIEAIRASLKADGAMR